MCSWLNSFKPIERIKHVRLRQARLDWDFNIGSEKGNGERERKRMAGLCVQWNLERIFSLYFHPVFQCSLLLAATRWRGCAERMRASVFTTVPPRLRQLPPYSGSRFHLRSLTVYR